MATNMKWSHLSDFLKEDSEIPTDIAFEIANETNTEIGTVKAHKLILAAHSVFFRKAFFGSGLNFKESSGTVIIKETTREAFSAMIDFIYEKNIYFGAKTVEELFDILNIAKRYQVDDLTLAITNHFKNFPWSPTNLNKLVMSVAYAEEFKQFPDETKALFTSAATFLNKKLTSMDDVLSFLCDKGSDNNDVAIKLLAEVKKLPCDNCEGRPCRQDKDWQIQHISHIKPGQVVKTTNNLRGTWPARYQDKACQVISVNRNPLSGLRGCNPDTVELQFLNPPCPPAEGDFPNPYTWKFVSRALVFKCNIDGQKVGKW